MAGISFEGKEMSVKDVMRLRQGLDLLYKSLQRRQASETNAEIVKIVSVEVVAVKSLMERIATVI